MVSQASSVPAVIGVFLLTVPPSNGAFGLTSTTRKPIRLSPALPVATIDAAELFDGSFFGGILTDDVFNESNTGNCIAASQGSVNRAPESTSSNVASSAKLNAIEKVTSSSLAWAAIASILSLSAALNTQAIGATLRLLTAISSWYMTRLEVAPLLTKCITGGLVALIGDYGAQWFEYKSSRKHIKTSHLISTSSGPQALSLRAGANTNNNPARSRKLSIHGTYDFRRGLARFLECLLISSPLMHYGYDLFESIMPVVGGAGIYRSLAALSHVLADCIFLDGIFVGTAILATGLMEGHSLRKHVLPNLRNVYFPTLKASIMTSGALVPLQFLSFRFLPVQLRVLSVNAVDLIWTGVVSFVSHSDHTKEGSRA